MLEEWTECCWTIENIGVDNALFTTGPILGCLDDTSIARDYICEIIATLWGYNERDLATKIRRPKPGLYDKVIVNRDSKHHTIVFFEKGAKVMVVPYTDNETPTASPLLPELIKFLNE